jgi:mono/diheme cytochrome c family protein
MAACLAAGCGSQGVAQLARGEEVYRSRCAACHEGAGRTGPVLDARTLAAYGTATTLFRYASTVMPQDAPGSLPRDDYWAVVAYLVKAIGSPHDAVLDSASGDRVILLQ